MNVQIFFKEMIEFENLKLIDVIRSGWSVVFLLNWFALCDAETGSESGT